MKRKIDEPKRTFIKKLLLAAGATWVLSSSKKAKAQERESTGDEILYRETEAFRAYYESLRK